MADEKKKPETRTACSGMNRVESLARDLFVCFIGNNEQNHGMSEGYLAEKAIGLAKNFYSIWDKA